MSALNNRLSQLSTEKRNYLLQMLPTHLASAGYWKRLQHALTNLEFMEAKISTLGPQALIDDYDLSEEDTLREIQGAIRQEAHVLEKRSDVLWQQLYNRLQWMNTLDTHMLAVERERRMMPGAPPWMHVKTPFHESPALIRTLVGHKSVLTCMVSLNS